ncbi:hypothetical protein LINGRAHAP2_LOCUS24379 [Linum grandiflorum]
MDLDFSGNSEVPVKDLVGITEEGPAKPATTGTPVHDLLLNGSWIIVAGDSQWRLVVQSFWSLVLDSEKMELIKEKLFRRHSDYAIVVEEIGMKLDFVWAPYVVNLT